MRPGRCALVWMVLLACTGDLYPWGQNGHRAVAAVAQRFLTSSARGAVAELLEGSTPAQASTWSDEIRAEDRWDCSAPFHYVTILPGESYPSSSAPGWDRGDAVRAVVFFSDLIRNPDTKAEQRGLALKFLIHVVGDLHQPLHVGRGCDRGGNDIRVSWFNEQLNLHSVWDRAIIDSENLSYTELVQFLGEVDPGQAELLQAASPLDWIEEAQHLHREVYRCNTGGDNCPCFCGDCEDGLSWFGGCDTLASCRLEVSGPVRLGYGYKRRAKPIVFRQLLKAGVRLAGLLNWIFAESNAPDDPLAALRENLEAIPGWEESFRSCLGS